MKKIIKYFFLFLFLGLIYIVYANYPRLDIITGFSSKSTASVLLLADRTQLSAEKEDNNFAPINKAKNEIDKTEKTVTATVFGLKSRTAVYREGLGAVLINDTYDKNASYLVPKRNKVPKKLPFPYGNLPQKDTVFSNINYKKMNTIIDKTFDSIHKTRSVLVLYKNQIIAEKYANGFDENSLHLGWSMTKSIVSTLYGILQKEKKLNIHDKAPIAIWKNDERSKITINNLLQMNSGLEWTEDYDNISDVTRMLFLETDMAKIQTEKSFVGKPNETWNYSSGTSNLLSKMLRNYFKTHQEYLDFWYSELIDKIGMHSMVIEADLAGNYVGSSYGWATTRDWAKFGLLYLHKGNWNGEQIFEPSWVDYVTTPTNTSNGEYGGHFWLNSAGYYPDAPKDMYSANGYQGQRVFIIPSKDLIIVRTGLSRMDFNEFLKEVVGSVE
ncbi:MAG: beta-lactamase family protein [Flavobacteriaceae bacterium]|nr:beta-lactamase family protein [Flavobacteriaceae bacterium]